MSEQHALLRHTREPDQAPNQANAPRNAAHAASFAKLATLHDAAVETASLASLLGRMPWLAGTLAAGAAGGLLAIRGLDITLPSAIWLMLMLAGSAEIIRLYRHTIRSPFQLSALRVFQSGLKGILLYAGLAWGAGAFLAVPADNLLTILGFSIAMVLIGEVALRRPMLALYFVLPAIAVPALATALGPLGSAAAFVIVSAGAAVIAGAEVLLKLTRRPPLLLTVS